MLDWYAAKPQTALRAWGRRPVSGIRTYFYLEALAFDCGGLPNDPKAIAEMAGISVEEVSECFDFFRSRCADPDAETLMPACVTESQTKMSESRSKRSQAGQVAGQASAEAKARTKNQQLTGNDGATNGNDAPTIPTYSNMTVTGTYTKTGGDTRARAEHPSPFVRKLETPLTAEAQEMEAREAREANVMDFLIQTYRLPVTVPKNQELYETQARTVCHATTPGREMEALSDFLGDWRTRKPDKPLQLRFVGEEFTGWLAMRRATLPHQRRAA